MSSPINPDPLNEQNRSCNQYANDIKEKSDEPLIRHWNNCINDDSQNRKDLITQEQKQRFLMYGCCKQILQCNNPNEWLAKNWDNKFGLKCPKSEPSPHPHFGDIKPYSGEGVM